MIRRSMLLGVVASVFFLSGSIAQAEITARFFVNGVETNEVVPERVEEWRFEFFRDGEKITEFKRVHQKQMHLIVLKDDLSQISHIHPNLIRNTGTFSIRVNQPTSDPDNQAAASVVLTPGNYFLIAEIFPDTGALVPRPEVIRLEVSAGDGGRREIRADTPNSNGDFVRFFSSEGEAGSFGDTYQVTLRVTTVPGCGGNLVRFQTWIKQWNDTAEAYFLVRDLQPWLMMTGHILMLNAEDDALEDRLFAHLHGMSDRIRPELNFFHFDRMRMAGRTHKLWFQAKHQDRVRTFPFVIQYDASYDGCDLLSEELPLK